MAATFNGAVGNPFFTILEYIEGGNLYRASKVTSGGFSFYSAAYNYDAGSPDATARQLVKTFLCDSDPSRPGGDILTNPSVGIIDPFAVGSYAFNFQVFAFTGVEATGLSPAGQLVQGTYPCGSSTCTDSTDGLAGRARIPSTFADGTTNTILYVEKYARCLTSSGAPTYGPGTERGNLWAWWDTGYVYYSRVGWQTWWGTGAGPASKFQVKPTPFLGTDSKCDGARASTGHDVMNVVMADASVRSLSAGIDAQVWWDLMTPQDGKVTQLP